MDGHGKTARRHGAPVPLDRRGSFGRSCYPWRRLPDGDPALGCSDRTHDAFDDLEVTRRIEFSTWSSFSRAPPLLSAPPRRFGVRFRASAGARRFFFFLGPVAVGGDDAHAARTGAQRGCVGPRCQCTQLMTTADDDRHVPELCSRQSVAAISAVSSQVGGEADPFVFWVSLASLPERVLARRLQALPAAILGRRRVA